MTLQAHRRSYFKSKKGAPLDLVWNNVPIKIISSVWCHGPIGRN